MGLEWRRRLSPLAHVSPLVACRRGRSVCVPCCVGCDARACVAPLFPASYISNAVKKKKTAAKKAQAPVRMRSLIPVPILGGRVLRRM